MRAFCSKPSMVTTLEVKVLYVPCRAGTVSLCKGVHREVESEGRKWQNIGLTNRNLIVGIVSLGNLTTDRIARTAACNPRLYGGVRGRRLEASSNSIIDKSSLYTCYFLIVVKIVHSSATTSFSPTTVAVTFRLMACDVGSSPSLSNLDSPYPTMRTRSAATS